MTDCWACALVRGDPAQHKTEWHWWNPLEGIVVTDLNPKGHAKRLLYVPRKHVPCGEETTAMHLAGYEALSRIARAVCANEGLTITRYDAETFSFTAHWHMQVELD